MFAQQQVFSHSSIELFSGTYDIQDENFHDNFNNFPHCQFSGSFWKKEGESTFPGNLIESIQISLNFDLRKNPR
jgi:hypothetical protein